jgi:hypothetical protein
MESRRQRIQLLSRLNRGKLALPSFLASLSEALRHPVEESALLPLSDTDALIDAFRTGYQNAIADSAISYRRFFARAEKRRVFRLADCLANELSNESVFFLTKKSEECGAIEIKASTLLRRAHAVISFDGDSIIALSKDRQQGLLIDHNTDDSDQQYEIAVWGDRWSLPVSCLRNSLIPKRAASYHSHARGISPPCKHPPHPPQKN